MSTTKHLIQLCIMIRHDMHNTFSANADMLYLIKSAMQSYYHSEYESVAFLQLIKIHVEHLRIACFLNTRTHQLDTIFNNWVCHI